MVARGSGGRFQSTKIGAFAEDLRLASVERLTGEEHRRWFINWVKTDLEQIIGEQSGRGGARPMMDIRVDGILGAPIDAVRLGGQVRVDFKYLREIARFGLNTLRELSPVDSGRYRDSYFCMIRDGGEVQPEAIPDHVIAIVLTNDQPYSRKIHVRGARLCNVPPLIFERARKAITGRYGNAVVVRMTFIELRGGYILKGNQLSQAKRYARRVAAGGPNVIGKSYRTDRKDLRAGETMKYPAIEIEVLG